MNECLAAKVCLLLQLNPSQADVHQSEGNNGCWTHLSTEVPRNVVILEADSRSLLLSSCWCSCTTASSCARARSCRDHPSEVGSARRVNGAGSFRHGASEGLRRRRLHPAHHRGCRRCRGVPLQGLWRRGHLEHSLRVVVRGVGTRVTGAKGEPVDACSGR